MRFIERIGEIPVGVKGCLAALGNFDGFHRGHQVIIGEAGRLAREMGVPCVVITTEPHPRSFFKPGQPAFRLTPAAERERLLDNFAVDALISLPFDQALANLAAQDFVVSVLKGALDVMSVIVGYDYRFGKDRGGGVNMLRWMGVEENFGVAVINPVSSDGGKEVYSSTTIRELLRAGNIREATQQLGHWWRIGGMVQAGDRRGRTIGFPTANIPLGEHLIPAHGVYAVRAFIDGAGDRAFGGVANVGRRPTFAKDDILLEAHLFDFSEDIYDKFVGIELVSFIRPEQKFTGITALKDQIARDSDTARSLLKDPEYDRGLFPDPTLEDYLDAHPAPPPMRW